MPGSAASPLTTITSHAPLRPSAADGCRRSSSSSRSSSPASWSTGMTMETSGDSTATVESQKGRRLPPDAAERSGYLADHAGGRAGGEIGLVLVGTVQRQAADGKHAPPGNGPCRSGATTPARGGRRSGAALPGWGCAPNPRQALAGTASPPWGCAPNPRQALAGTPLPRAALAGPRRARPGDDYHGARRPSCKCDVVVLSAGRLTGLGATRSFTGCRIIAGILRGADSPPTTCHAGPALHRRHARLPARS